MTTEQLCMKLKRLYQIIGENENVDIEKYFTCLHFQEVSSNYESGVYIYSDEKGYHWASVGDRGGIDEEIILDDFNDIFFKQCWGLVSTLSTEFARNNRVKGKDWRRIMFSKRLELLSKVSMEYYEKGKDIIDEILEKNPYDDELLG